jgi:hypothetical protein
MGHVSTGNNIELDVPALMAQFHPMSFVILTNDIDWMDDDTLDPFMEALNSIRMDMLRYTTRTCKSRSHRCQK